MLPNFITRLSVRAMRSELLDFIDDHEDTFVELVYQEMERLDERTPDEKSYIDIKMAPLGADIARAILRAVRQFLRGL